MFSTAGAAVHALALRETDLTFSIFAAHSIRQVKQHDLRNHRTTSLWCENAILPRKRTVVKQ